MSQQQPPSPPGIVPQPQQRTPNQLLTIPGFSGGSSDVDLTGGPQTPWWRRRWVIVLAVILLIAILGYLLLPLLRPQRQVTYQVGRAQRGNLAQTINATGPVQAAATYNLSYPGNTTATITEIDVKIGQSVKKGQVLSKLDTTALQNQVDQSQQTVNSDLTQLGHASANLANVQASNSSSTTSAQTNLNNARTTQGDQNTAQGLSVSQAQTKLNQANTNLSDAQTQRDTTVNQAQITRNSAISACDAAATPAPTPAPSASSTVVANGSNNSNSSTSGITVGQTHYNSLSDCIQAANDAYNTTVNNANSTVTTAQQNVTTAQQALTSAQAQATATSHTQAGTVNVNANQLTATANSNNSALENAQNQVTQASNTLKMDQLRLKDAQNNLDNATLKAPHDGVVTQINGAVGGLPGASGTGTSASSATGTTSNSTFIQLVDLSTFQILASVNESDTANLNVGQPATFTVNAYGDRQFKGTVSEISPSGQTSQNVVTYPVSIDVDMNSAKGARLLPSMTATVTITVLQRNNVLEIPVNAINFARLSSSTNATTGATPLITSRQANAATAQARQQMNDLLAQNPNLASDNPTPAFVLERQGTTGPFTAKPVVLGLTDGQFYEVLQGLDDGESIIVGTANAGGFGGRLTPGAGGGGGGGGGGAPIRGGGGG